MDGSQPLDPRKTIFVGGVPRPLRAGMLSVYLQCKYMLAWLVFCQQPRNLVQGGLIYI